MIYELLDLIYIDRVRGKGRVEDGVEEVEKTCSDTAKLELLEMFLKVVTHISCSKGFCDCSFDSLRLQGIYDI